MNDVLAHRARATPDATALIDAGSGREWSYAKLDAAVDRTAGRLAELGIDPGDHLGCLLDTRPAAVRLLHAALRLGCVLAPLNTRLTPSELGGRIERADLAGLICEADTEANAVEASEVPIASVNDTERTEVTTLIDVETAEFEPTTWSRDDPCLMLATSGTTGRPKLVVLTVGNLVASAVASAFRLGVLPDDRWLSPLSVYHMGGLAPIVRSALYGTTTVLVGNDGTGFDTAATHHALAEHDCTGVSLVPTMLRRLLDAGDLPDSLRFVLLGGAPASTGLIERCERRNVPVHPTYGMTETTSQVATARPDEAFAHSGTVGQPLVGTDVAVIDAAGERVAPGETGEIAVSGPTVFASYYDDPDATAAAVSEHGFHTGDVGYRDTEGRLWVTGRLDEQIVTGGENVDPEVVADALRAHSAVDDAAVVGLDDPEWGERVGALVVADDDLDAETLRTHCRERLAGFEIPRTIAFVDSLPRTASGTVERDVVRETLR
ncbi:o-succinylbenzoate--CoA ligase [Halococcus saccharolyticus]|uniref:O-succinylbenzoate-CoA ligase n=1 Tax=Halococcus saccharolyticus DSM 5350 TaxID=1227455 RepID=M0MSD7_9EURY|nr:o-succinylbenzoate--CoA ligase [Halococcus saccharolyticus]EMA47385.1 o-succinylbenzoate-CoA ligase [Halococcus saccharolyticus DSM 5350]